MKNKKYPKETNKIYDELDAFIFSHQKFFITTHESPDGDGLGAQIAFREYLFSLGKNVHIVNGDPLPPKYDFLDAENIINIADKFTLPVDYKDYSLIIIDTNTFSNTGGTYTLCKEWIKDFFIIDHHEGNSDIFASNLVLVHASSASEIIAQYLIRNNFIPSKKAATALYTGILFDTGGFRYSKTSSETFLVISWLVKHGADPTSIYELIYENNQLATLLLKSRMLSSIETHHQGRLIYMELTTQMLEETGGEFSEGELNINIPLTIKGVEISVLLKQDIGGQLKVSMRSKGDLDVSIIAISRDGGGHKNAAGFKSNLSFEETKKIVLSDLERFFI
ncbi:MAG: bifunctional oligoribonuclease/PAP phosphatase NrnA [Spirochaetes bacterium]|nr:bifunctional oligoribonuclease/PAP phosphatase NrnA [Spirochaetota bacterium]MBN2772517.1 bifunctional oligoribonuclease/PAP phosphatase NrnA [Spirochaetota bacterium]